MIGDIEIEQHQEAVAIFESFVTNINEATFRKGIPWRSVIHIPNILLRSELMNSTYLHSAMNALQGRSGSAREITQAATITGKSKKNQ